MTSNERTPPRSEAIDVVRGVVMALMTLDHTRDFFSSAAFDPMDFSRTTPAMFLTRWVTHFCAPTFVFLAGTGAYLYGARARSRSQLAAFLLTRGLWLVLLEFTLVHLGWFFNFRYDVLIGQVIWAIGWSMVALAGLAWLPTWAVAVLGAALVAGHNVFDAPGQPPWELVVSQLRPGLLYGSFQQRGSLLIAYPVLPWLGVMALGYGFGAVWTSRHRRPIAVGLGAAALTLFVGLRASGVYGDPQPWTPRAEGWATELAFLDCSKYPPSLCYVLMTLGPALLVLAASDRPPEVVGRALATFGRVPLFFYLLHVPLIHVAAMAVAWPRYGDVAFLLNHPLILGRGAFPPDYGFGLPAVYAATAVMLLILYPLCVGWGRLKRQYPESWLRLL